MPFESRDNEQFSQSQMIGFLKANYETKCFELWQKDAPSKNVGNTLADFEIIGIRHEVAEKGADRWNVFVFDLKDGDDRYQIKFSRDQFTCYLLLKQILSLKPGQKFDLSFHSKGISLTKDGVQVRYHPQSISAPGPEKDMNSWVWGDDVVQWMTNAANFINNRLENEYAEIKDEPLSGNASAPQKPEPKEKATAGLPQEDHRNTTPLNEDEDDLPF